MNIKKFSLISWVNETRFLVLDESCECKCNFNESVCNPKQQLNHDGCWCECKELDDWSSCRDDCVWNSSTCDCECDMTCKIDEYLDIN